MDDLVSRCVDDLEKLSLRDAVVKYPLLASVAATVLPTLNGEQLALVVSLASNRGLIDASQKCRSCAGEIGNGNLCESCYRAVLGGKFSEYA